MVLSTTGWNGIVIRRSPTSQLQAPTAEHRRLPEVETVPDSYCLQWAWLTAVGRRVEERNPTWLTDVTRRCSFRHEPASTAATWRKNRPPRRRMAEMERRGWRGSTAACRVTVVPQVLPVTHTEATTTTMFRTTAAPRELIQHCSGALHSRLPVSNLYTLCESVS